MSGAWWNAVVQAGAVPASFVPPAATGRRGGEDLERPGAADVVEGDGLAVHSVGGESAVPPVASFLDGIQYWKVVGYDGVVPLVRGFVAAAVRRRGPDRRLCTTLEATRDFAVAPLAALGPERRRVLERTGADLVDVTAAEEKGEALAGQPGLGLELARRAVDGVRQDVERALAERALAALAEREWLVVDGLLSVSARLARHPRALGVIKSHGAQFFEGADLERALTLPAGHRTNVFRARGGHARNDVYSWYLRLWPWEGNDLLFGLLRLEARADGATLAVASRISAWLMGERAPLSTPDARWDRLLYPIHDVETYLKACVPRDLLPAQGSRLPRTGGET